MKKKCHKLYGGGIVYYADAVLGTIPNSKLLAGLKEFDTTSQPAEQGSSNMAAKLMSQLSEKSEGQKSVPAMIATGEGLLSLSKKVVEKILAGEFIDFADLPPAKGKVKSIPTAGEGQIVVVQAADLMESRNLIPDLATWVRCFGIYAAMITSKEPDRTKNLLAYMCLIAKCSLKYKWPSWAVYDLNFRQDAADTGLKDWSKVDPSTYTQCFTGASISQDNWCRSCHSIDHVSDTCPIKPTNNPRKRESQSVPALAPLRKRQAPHSNPQPCRKYKYNGDCSYADKCIFQHKCSACGEYTHPVSKCTQDKK